MFDDLDKNATAVEEASSSLGRTSLTHVPHCFSRLLREKAWQSFRSVSYHREVHYQDGEFEKFVTTPWDKGLGRKEGIAGIIRVVEAIGGPDAPEALRLLKAEMPAAGEHGGARAGAGRKAAGKREADPDANQVRRASVNKGGNSQAAILGRLKRDHPGLHAEVVSGEKTAKQAAIEAGFRRRRIEILDGDPEYVAAQLERHWPKDIIDKVCAILRPGSSAATSTQSPPRLIDEVIVPTGQAGRTTDSLLTEWRQARRDREGGNITPEVYIHRRRVEIMDGPPGDILAQLDQHWPRVFAIAERDLPQWLGGPASRRGSSQQSRIRHSTGTGTLAAAGASVAWGGVAKVVGEFKKLNTRQSRAAFADHWIGIWSRDFDVAWQVVYELLKIVEEDELYKDPRRVGPQAPGFPKDTHAKESSYPDFKAYFTERVKQPFDHWAELERVHQYAHKYAPEIFELSLPASKTEGVEDYAGDAAGGEAGREAGRSRATGES